MSEVDERFAFITDADGNKYQALIFDEDGTPVDWDEIATRVLIEGK